MKALLLLSGGFDSPVAGKLMQDKGLTLTALHYSFEPLTDNTSVEKSKNLAKHLGIKKLIVIKLGNLLTEISKKCKHKNYFVIQKRLFLKIAEKVAKQVLSLPIHPNLTNDEINEVINAIKEIMEP